MDDARAEGPAGRLAVREQGGGPVEHPHLAHDGAGVQGAGRRGGGQVLPDGRTLAIAHDTKVTLFDTVTGQQLGAAWTVTTGTFDPYAVEDPMPALAFTADGSLLRVVGHDGAFQDLPADPARAVPAVGERAGRQLTQEEWREHVGTDLSYRESCPTK
ncbi:hypothetical protein [Acrocarpospora sp. B8E8]|uniref:hypothetical protein n=1 Tax=Acrocarpospora sp. B8E8 TaxID=3153572 RepID=UPI00325E7E39